MRSTSVPTQPQDRVSAGSCADAGEPNPTDQSIPMMLCAEWQLRNELFRPCWDLPDILIHFPALPLVPWCLLHRQRERESAQLVALIILKSRQPLCLGDLQPHGLCDVHHPGKHQRNTASMGWMNFLYHNTAQKINSLLPQGRSQEASVSRMCSLNLKDSMETESGSIQGLQGRAFLRRLECYWAEHHHLREHYKPKLPYSRASWLEKKK